MECKKDKNIVRKIIYILLFALIIFCFIEISKKYSQNSIQETILFSDYYENENNDYITVINGNETIRKIKKGKHIIFIGNSSSKWSKAYASELNRLLNNLANEGIISKDDNIYYYDLANDKQQKNSKYYDLRTYLKGALVTLDSSENNLLSPVLYIVDEGEIKYYNIATVAMKNVDTVEDYWNEEQELMFEEEITAAIQKYYLNN